MLNEIKALFICLTYKFGWTEISKTVLKTNVKKCHDEIVNRDPAWKKKWYFCYIARSDMYCKHSPLYVELSYNS